MLDWLANWQHSFWAIALLIVALDAIVLLPPGQFCFAFGRDDRPKVRVTTVPYLVRGQELMFAAVSFFARPYFISSASAADLGKAQLAELRNLAKRQRSIGLCSMLAAALAFVAGPLLTAEYDIGNALLMVLPLIYANAVVAIVVIALAQKAWRLSRQNVFYIAFELLVCPVLAVNLNKRLAYRAVAIPNTFQLVGSDDDAHNRILANLEYQNIPAPQGAQGQLEHG
jgi:hypothetical protein